MLPIQHRETTGDVSASIEAVDYIQAERRGNPITMGVNSGLGFRVLGFRV